MTSFEKISSLMQHMRLNGVRLYLRWFCVAAVDYPEKRIVKLCALVATDCLIAEPELQAKDQAYGILIDDNLLTCVIK